MSDYFEFVKPIYIENWPKELYKYSIRSVDIPLTIDQAERLGTNMGEFGESFLDGKRKPIDDIEELIGEAMKEFPKGAFIRLGSRSPKDNWYGIRNSFKVNNTVEALTLLCGTSERLSDDLHIAIIENYEPHIWVREWHDIRPWAEFRCFMQGGKLVGISQYNYLNDIYYPEIEEHEKSIKDEIVYLFENHFKMVWNGGDVVFDVFLKIHGLILLEVNPFFNLTDPCLFKWTGEFEGDFDRSFRFNRKTEH